MGYCGTEGVTKRNLTPVQTLQRMRKRQGFGGERGLKPRKMPEEQQDHGLLQGLQGFQERGRDPMRVNNEKNKQDEWAMDDGRTDSAVE